MKCREGCGACCIAPSISGFKAEVDVCGSDRDDAIRIIGWLEQMTAA